MHRYIGTHMSMQIHFYAYTFLMYTYTYIQNACAHMHTHINANRQSYKCRQMQCVLTIDRGYSFFVCIGYTHFDIVMYT